MKSSYLDIILCDDHYISLVGIETVLRRYLGSGIKVRLSGSGEEALQLFKDHKADLVVLDLGLPSMSGIETIKSFRQISTKCKLIVLSGSDDPFLFQQVLQLKVNAVLKKLNSAENLGAALELVINNEEKIYVDPTVEGLIKNAIDLPLTPREYEVLISISHGLTSQEIANKLGCSLPTIKSHRVNIMNKTGARNSSELLAWFLTKGNIKRNSRSGP